MVVYHNTAVLPAALPAARPTHRPPCDKSLPLRVFSQPTRERAHDKDFFTGVLIYAVNCQAIGWLPTLFYWNGENREAIHSVGIEHETI